MKGKYSIDISATGNSWFYFSQEVTVPFELTEANGPFHMGFLLPFFNSNRENTEAYWTGKEYTDNDGNTINFT